jgi:hypothetical protein
VLDYVRWPRSILLCLKSYLDESDVGSLLSEALTADVEAVLADETGSVGADTADRSISIYSSYGSLRSPSRMLTRHGSPFRRCGA